MIEPEAFTCICKLTMPMKELGGTIVNEASATLIASTVPTKDIVGSLVPDPFVITTAPGAARDRRVPAGYDSSTTETSPVKQLSADTAMPVMTAGVSWYVNKVSAFGTGSKTVGDAGASMEK